MLIEFSVGNFRSFRERVTLSMVAAKLTAKEKVLDESNVFAVEGAPPLLTSAAVYGANASGKSNLVAAIGFMRRFVDRSSMETRPTGSIDVQPFLLSDETADKPSHFEIVFLLEGKRYRYGFEVTQERVETEWLYYVPTQREARLFLRQGNWVELGKAFREGKEIVERTRPNALFLSVVAQFNGPVAQSVTQWFRQLGIVSGLNDMDMRVHTMRSFVDGTDRDGIRDLVRKLDLGIDDLAVEQVPASDVQFPEDMPGELRSALSPLIDLPGSEHFAVHTVHLRPKDGGTSAAQVEFDLDDQESEGTKKLFALAGLLVSTLRNGRVLVIDELDARLHPTMTREIVSLFNSREANPNHAQLIFTTHDTNLLDNRLFRRDQIWFTEKDRLGATHLYSLAEFRIRNDEAFERNYIRGRYGAIPFLGNLHQIAEMD